MDATTFIAGFLSCTTVTFFLLSMALLLHLTRQPHPGRPEAAGDGRMHAEVLTLRVSDYQEAAVTKLCLEAGYQVHPPRAVNGNRLLDITAHRMVTR